LLEPPTKLKSHMATTTKESKINIFDLNMVKQVMDDHAKGVILEEFTEDSSYSNKKLVLGVFGCSLALLSHYAPIPFPHNIPLLIGCAILYFMCSGILQYMATYIERDIILTTEQHLGKALVLHSNIELAANLQNVTYHLELCDAKTEKGTKLEMSVVDYFDRTGKFYPNIYEKDVKKMLVKVKGKLNN